ncbi:MAG: phosphatidylglycerol lysyltransferase domain-containing protein [Oscillospiraceae bacterium]|nr:phosphatidylglycerol lysyltransferase domain-containing protein [Oscillospiraceae bacterium]
MIELHPVTLADKSWIDPLVLAENSPSADYNFGNIFLWDESFHQQVCQLEERLIVMPCYEEKPFFAWPVGSGPIASVLEQMHQYARANGFPFVLRGVTGEHLPTVRSLWGDKCTIEDERDYWDYLYSAEKLDTLSGKKLHGKRNHINRFTAENDWRFAPLSISELPACQALLDEWMALCGEDERDGIDEEYTAILRAFQYYEALSLEGGALWVNDRLAAFTIGEVISSNTFNVHFEKAYASINGAYTMINREFVRQIRRNHPEIQWINREDDTGRPSLRQSKLSYQPDRMVEKYKVTIYE